MAIGRGLPLIRAAFLLVVLLQGVTARTSAAAAAPKVIRVEGRLVVKTHKEERWTVVTSWDGPTYSLPFQPRDARWDRIPAASYVSLKCRLDDRNPRRCLFAWGATVTRAAAPVQSVGVVFRMLVMVVGISGDCFERPLPVANVTDIYKKPGGYIDFLSGCSYNLSSIDANALTVISVTVPCNDPVLNCDEDAIAAAARASAVRQLGRVAVASFNQYTYVMPNLGDTCDWYGLAELPGRQTWYSPEAQGIFDKGTVVQELLHNLGIWHGWRDGEEYGDNSTCMGDGLSCPSAPELWRLGWATPLETLDGERLRLRTPRSFVLPATVLGPQNAYLKIQPTWLGGRYSKNVYLALRQRMGADEKLLDEFAGKINIHQLDADIDNNFRALADPKSTVIGTIRARSYKELTRYRLVVRTGALLESGTKMVVTLCRYLHDADECPATAARPPSPGPPRRPSRLSPPRPPPSSPMHPTRLPPPPLPLPPPSSPLPKPPRPPRQPSSPQPPLHPTPAVPAAPLPASPTPSQVPPLAPSPASASPPPAYPGVTSPPQTYLPPSPQPAAPSSPPILPPLAQPPLASPDSPPEQPPPPPLSPPTSPPEQPPPPPLSPPNSPPELPPPPLSPPASLPQQPPPPPTSPPEQPPLPLSPPSFPPQQPPPSPPPLSPPTFPPEQPPPPVSPHGSPPQQPPPLPPPLSPPTSPPEQPPPPLSPSSSPPEQPPPHPVRPPKRPIGPPRRPLRLPRPPPDPATPPASPPTHSQPSESLEPPSPRSPRRPRPPPPALEPDSAPAAPRTPKPPRPPKPAQPPPVMPAPSQEAPAIPPPPSFPPSSGAPDSHASLGPPPPTAEGKDPVAENFPPSAPLPPPRRPKRPRRPPAPPE